MTTATITLQVDADLAKAYRSAPPSEQSKLNLLINLSLRALFNRSVTLSELMDNLSNNAQMRGLTPEKLETMLNAC